MYISDEHSRDILAAIPSQTMAKGDRASLERIVLMKLDVIIGTYHDVLNTLLPVRQRTKTLASDRQAHGAAGTGNAEATSRDAME